jgi:hypothetical protein
MVFVPNRANGDKLSSPIAIKNTAASGVAGVFGKNGLLSFVTSDEPSVVVNGLLERLLPSLKAS